MLSYWDTDDLTKSVEYKSEIIGDTLRQLADDLPELEMKVRGRGMVWGVDMPKTGLAGEVSTRAFEKNLLVETCGNNSQVVKFLPPLIIEEDLLREGLKRFTDTVRELWTEKQAAYSGDVL